MSTSNEVRKNVLHMYKNLIKLSKTISIEKQRNQTLNTIRKEFRKYNDTSTNNANINIDELLKKANSNLNYLKMITPKSKQHQDEGAVNTKLTNNKTDINKNSRRPVSNWTGNNMDPDSVRRHYNSLKRAGFRDNNHAKGGMF